MSSVLATLDYLSTALIEPLAGSGDYQALRLMSLWLASVLTGLGVGAVLL